MAKKYTVGFLVLVILTASIYILLPDNVRIDVGKTYSIFKVWENDSWVLAGQEYSLMFDGTKKMRASSRTVEQFVDGEIIKIIRTANFKNNVTVIDTYIFNGNDSDVKLFPISHDITVLNGEGYILVYEVTKLEYFGETVKDIESPQEFGHQMKVEWEDGNYYSRIWGYSGRDEGKLTIKYRPDSENFTKQVRLFDPPSDSPIGYEFLDNGSVVHIWNNATISDYYFDKDSGIQLTNHYEDYWTRNIFCLGYYAGENWNKIACADELNNFNKNIETDNLTYVNATLWKDIEYFGYDLRLGVQYNLGLNDESLSITIYAKNTGVDIPFDLGFAWKITDWDIPSREEGVDSIFINYTDYDLDGVFDLTFSNMSNSYVDDDTNESFLFYDSYLRGYDWTEFLRIGWNKNLDYKVRMVGNGNQEDFYVSILINASHFNPNQEKSTTFKWIDAEGDYTGVSWDTTNTGDGSAITTDNNFFWISDEINHQIDKYTMNGTYVSSFSVSSQSGDPEGITTNGTFIWVMDDSDDEVYKYTMDGIYTGDSFDTSGVSSVGYGITTDNNFFWIADLIADEVDKYFMNGTYTGDSFSVFPETDAIQGITTNGLDIWAVNQAQDDIDKYTLSGTYNLSYDATSEVANLKGVTNNGTFIWVVDNSLNKVFQYEMPPVVAPPSDTCTYTSGNWEVDCSDNCVIESNVNLVGNNLIFINTGIFWMKANIINYGGLTLSSGCNIVFDDTKQLISS